MIVATGATGFIGSHLIKRLNAEGFKRIIAVDRSDYLSIKRNLHDKIVQDLIDRDEFFKWIEANHTSIEFIFHLGARTDTTEMDTELLDELNTEYSKKVWKACYNYQIPLIYASSAATYGDGTRGFSDNHDSISELKPLNPYGWSKHEFDLWALSQKDHPFYWAGLKFFNVFGSDEEHKGKMASMIHQMEQQILKIGQVKLFKSYRPDYADGEQKRDFISVEKVTERMFRMMIERRKSGIYNVGTGKAKSFNEMALELFEKHNLPPKIEYIDMPVGIRDKYQYFTEADMSKANSL